MRPQTSQLWHFRVAGSRKSGKLTCSRGRALWNGSGPTGWFPLVVPEWGKPFSGWNWNLDSAIVGRHMPSDVPSLRSRRPRRQNMNSRMNYFMSIPTGRGFLYTWSKMDSTQTFFKKKTIMFKNFDTFQRMSRREHSTPIPTGRGFLYKCPKLGRKSQEFRWRLICGRDFS